MAATRIAACPDIGHPSGQTSGRRSSSARRSAASRRATSRGSAAVRPPSRISPVAGRQRPPGSMRSARSAARYVHGETRSKKNVTRGRPGPRTAGSGVAETAAGARLARRSIREMTSPIDRWNAARDRIWRFGRRPGVRSSTTNRKMLARSADDSSNVGSGERRQPFPLAQIGGSPSPPYLPRSAIHTTNGRPTPAPSISSATSGPCSSCATSPAVLAGSSSSSACCQGSRPSSCVRG